MFADVHDAPRPQVLSSPWTRRLAIVVAGCAIMAMSGVELAGYLDTSAAAADASTVTAPDAGTSN